MEEAGRTILIINDEPGEVQQLRGPLEKAGYAVFEAHSGDKALEQVYAEPPGLVVLDLMVQGKSGADVCAELKGDNVYGHLPIILSVPEHALARQINWETLKVDDYLVLPCSEKELLLRTTLCFSRASRDLDANPLTGLPGNVTIIREIERRINSGSDFALAYLDIDHFKSFNDRYGFARGDEVLRMTARILVNVVRGFEGDSAYIGHVGGDDFILIMSPDNCTEVCEQIIGNFDQILPTFYEEDDRARGSILSTDRRGNRVVFPLMTLSIGLVDSRSTDIAHYGEASYRASQLKSYAKTISGSVYVKDRRK
jgi:PleD family two-component response regulator